MISEIYVPRNDLAEFMMDVRKVAAKENYDIVYGTIRLIGNAGSDDRAPRQLGQAVVAPHQNATQLPPI